MQHFEHYAEHVPLELFVMAGNFLEEIISPLPSFVVLIPAGAAAEVQGRGLWSLLLLATLAGFGRLLAAMILYAVSRKSEEALLKSNRRLFGISHADINRLSSRLGRSPRRDWIVLFFLNGTPMLPTAPLSLVCGFIKVPFKMFVTSAFFGSIMNAFFYLVLGYTGFKSAEQLQRLEIAGYIATAVVVVVVSVLFIRWQHKRRIARRAARTKASAKDAVEASEKPAKNEATKKHQP